MGAPPYPLAQLIPSLARTHTVGLPSLQNMSLSALMGVGIVSLIGVNLVGFIQGAIFAPAPYLVASAAARSRANYSTYKALGIGATTLLMPGTSLLSAPGILLGLLWMYPKLEKHLKFQNRLTTKRGKRRRRKKAPQR